MRELGDGEEEEDDKGAMVAVVVVVHGNAGSMAKGSVAGDAGVLRVLRRRAAHCDHRHHHHCLRRHRRRFFRFRCHAACVRGVERWGSSCCYCCRNTAAVAADDGDGGGDGVPEAEAVQIGAVAADHPAGGCSAR